jgi:Ca2+-binding EF-hand superfamily protein
MRVLLIGIISIVLDFGVAYADNKHLQKQFDELDRDVNGFISHDEVQSQSVLVRSMNLYYQDSFLEADYNKDGVLDREELYAYEEDISAE